MTLKILIFYFLFTFFINCRNITEKSSNFVEYCSLYNYPVEVHDIITDDGYILKYFRIQAKNQKHFQQNLPVIYLQHGLLDSSDTWIVNSKPDDYAPAFFFANKGFDVWLGNSRGNTYSRKHTILNPDKDKKFWDFSWDQMAEFDLPASFIYINKITGQKINYLGHSQGSCIMFAALSQRNQIIQKYLNKFLAFGPVAFVTKNSSKLFVQLAEKKIDKLFLKLGSREFFKASPFGKTVYPIVCKKLPFSCRLMLKILSDKNPRRDQRLDIVGGHYPAGTSTKDLAHFCQEIRSERFQKYDYGNPEKNLKKYGQTTPPEYHLENIKTLDVKLYLFSGKEDKIACPDDVRKIIESLHGMKNLWFREYPYMGHSTFLWGKEGNQHLYDALEMLEN